MRVEAWLTSAVDEASVSKALVLAGSLRRVCTSKKMVVLTTHTVPNNLRSKLKVAFDQVVLFEQGNPNGLSLEDRAKLEGFSLRTFDKCMYLSPNMMVLKNCDDIFEKYSGFAAWGNENGLNSSVYLFTPSLEHGTSLEEVACNNAGNLDSCIKLWTRKCSINWEPLDEEYNTLLKLKGGSSKCLGSNVTIVNFCDAHPAVGGELTIAHQEGWGPIEKYAVKLCGELQAEMVYRNPIQQSEVFKEEPIAIVGLSFRLPGANNEVEFWDMLVNHKEGIVPLPEHRWSRDFPKYLSSKNRNVEAGFLPFPIDEFDSKFFGISGMDAEFMDPQQRLLHEVTWEALEDAMIDPTSLRGTQTGIFSGSWLQDYKELVSKAVDVDFFRCYVGNAIATQSARLSHFLETTGPSISTESGCSSAIVALDMACKSLRNLNSSTAIVCGVNLLLYPFDIKTFPAAFSPNGRCKTFDEKADGFGRAEGCGVLILKRLSDAVREGDKIWGLIRGSGITQEGLSRSLGTPTVLGESLAMELALREANVDPTDVSFIEAHGTGTAVGDPLEMAAIAKSYSREGRTAPLVIGSVKTNVGHTESASGITGIIKVLLSMKNEKIPSHLNLEKLNPAINLDAIPAVIPLESMPWSKKQDKPRLAGVSSFGITGTDGHVIIQEPPNPFKGEVIENEQQRPLHLLKLSAKCPESLQKLLSKYEVLLNKPENSERLADIAYSANAGRATFSHRAVIIASDAKQAASILRDESFKQAEVHSSGKQLCFLFTGQGSQYPNMAANLYQTSPIFRDHFDRCDQVLKQRYGINLQTVLWGNSTNGTELSRTLYSQTSIFCVEYCLLKLWESWGVKPDYVMGHSLGEFAAAVAAGALGFEDALMLVAERSRLIDSLPPGKMLVIKANKMVVDQTIECFKEIKSNIWVDYAALNSPDQTVVAGDSSMIDDLAKFCEEKSLKTIILAATHAFHSRHMEPILESYRKVAKTVMPVSKFKDAPKYISGMEGKLIEVESISSDYWVRHTREPVRFIDACNVAESEGCSLFLEVGPHPVLSALTMMNCEGHSVTCLPSIRRKEDEWATMLDTLSKLYLSDWKGEINWKGFDRYYNRSHVPLPLYPFNRKPVWKDLEAMTPNTHPLLGKVIPTAGEDTIFESRITLKNTPFVQDHVIGSTAVFPGAGFLEMCLAGGHLTVQQPLPSGEFQFPQRPVVVQSLQIALPLGLYDQGFCRLQTTIKLDGDCPDEISYSVGVHRFVSSTASGMGEWVSHATAKFLPVPSDLINTRSAPFIDILGLQNTSETYNSSEFYEQLPEVGLRFGPQFQSLEKGWKTGKGILLAVKVPTTSQVEHYLIHPVVADAMLQAIMLWTSQGKPKLKLQVPVQIGEFVWLQNTSSTIRYIYCTTNDAGSTECILLDGEGLHLARMSRVDFMETSEKLIEGMLQRQGISMSKLWREVWKSAPGPLQFKCDLHRVGDIPLCQFNDQQKQVLSKLNDLNEYERSFLKNLNNLALLFFLNALYKLKWTPLQGIPFTAGELAKLLPASKEHFKRYIRFFLRALARTGMITTVTGMEDKYYFPGPPPTQNEIDTGLQTVVIPEDRSRVEYILSVRAGENLFKVWLGEVDPLQLLFPEDPNEISVGHFYASFEKWVFDVCLLKAEEFIRPLLDEAHNISRNANKPGSPPPVTHILEVGAGTGSLTKEFLKLMDKPGRPFDYHFTDISASFFTAAETTFADYSKQMTFKKFDMEKDPLAQGFCPGYYDVIVAFEVIHVAKNIRETLRNIQCLLKPGGIFIFLETTIQDPRITQIFGLLEGYWQYEDLNLRPYQITLTPQQWEKELRELNYETVICTPAYNNCQSVIAARLSTQIRDETALVQHRKPQYSWVIFCHQASLKLAELLEKKLAGVNRKVYCVQQPSICSEEGMKEMLKNELQVARNGVESIEGIIYLWGIADDITDRNQCQVSLPLISLLQVVLEYPTPPKLFVVTRGSANVDGFEVTNPIAATMNGIIRSLTNENTTMRATCLDISPDDSAASQVDEIFFNLWDSNKGNRNYAFRDENRWSNKLVAANMSNYDPLPLPNGCDRFRVILPNTRLISDLEFAPLESRSVSDNEIEIQVKAIALNFRDVFAVLKPIVQFENINSVGLDFAGVVTKVGSKVCQRKVGDRVVGLNNDPNLSLPSHVIIKENVAVPIPPQMTFAEGSTLPAVLLTVVHCLIQTTK